MEQACKPHAQCFWGNPPAVYVHMACTAAVKLTSLFKKTKHLRALEQPLTASSVTKHEDLLAETFRLASSLGAAINRCPKLPQAATAFLQALPQPYKVAAKLGTIMLWLQRSPALLNLSAILWQPTAVVVEHAAAMMPSAICLLCWAGLYELSMLAGAISKESLLTQKILLELHNIDYHEGACSAR